MQEVIRFNGGIGMELRKARKQKGLSKNRLAKRAALEVVYLDYIERGRKSICLNTLIRIATILDIPLLQFEKYR